MGKIKEIQKSRKECKCEKCRSLNGRAEKNGQPWGYECMKYGDTVERSELHSTKTFRR